MSHTSPVVVPAPGKTEWDGGVSPMNASYGKLMMWFFLLSDAFTFSALLITYGLVRSSHPAYDGTVENFVFSPAYWPIPEKVFASIPFFHGLHAPLVFVGIMTFILIMSSVTMVLAVEAGQRMDRRAVEKWMLWTILGGICFLSCQAWEWTHFIIGDGVTGANLVRNEYGPPDFADFFFFITGFHGFHVFSGVLLNFLIFYNTVTGVYDRRGHYEMVEKVGLYWHFVDLVWVFVFTFFYLV
ncbi:MAG TPA: cytochrome c oxidase subunit 3 [Cyclobacteriaceae bacterium]|nr:cytochrome c oxidase subunit 3 [Cyclobacteriaceae bacterium]HMV10618.1 cytochrome c oxidase subunit 3 [Cyclobacteriaceae bacterium]HMV91012.1 cytochrome c oxidase subunit 3 [Cyclobacteriaceae bacterium]HMX02605.1 cytochrome c oxidase subunit 3 [Cyclobacteriaceae bacterium]HMX50896.1 cytochrome c oxidase subunit 3 [Cyclobacteriaceae bacterium]